MNEFRSLSINERYFSQFQSSQINKNFGKYLIDGTPDTTATLAEINSPVLNSSEGRPGFKNKQLLIAGLVFLIIIIGGIAYANYKNKDDKVNV